MALLAQQELMEAPPQRRLIVSHGHTAWWGCDPSTQRVALASAANGSSGPVYTSAVTPFADLRGGARLSAIYADTRSFVMGLLDDGWPLPGYAVCELPAGNPPNVELIYAAGVQQAAVYDAVFEWSGARLVVETMPTGRWKLLACGHGGIKKPTWKGRRFEDVRETYGVLRWARLHGLTNTERACWDRADAMGLAEAARRTVALEVR